MAETPSKRLRNENYGEDVEETKRHKSYYQILSLLEEEEDEPTQDLSSLITTLQQEIDSLSSSTTTQTLQENPFPPLTPTLQDYPSSSLKPDEEDDKYRVIRHLLEASDDELGIPNRDNFGSTVASSENDFNGLDDGFSPCDGLWEIEDANANYHALLQSELFM